jgi:hypothetical protein
MEGAVSNKWQIPGWSAAQAQIREAAEILCAEKVGIERAEVIDQIVALVRAIGRGEPAPPEADPLLNRDEFERESWARAAARLIVEGAMRVAERLPDAEQTALKREIARHALWHTPNSLEELNKLRDWFKIENLRQPHLGDDPPGRE